jgi:arginyl-tRNA synthetase
METVQSLLAARLRAALPTGVSIEPQITPTADARFGDYQTNVAMLLSKQAKTNPRQLAQQIIEKIDVVEMCEPPEIAGAGFINFRLKREWLEQRTAALAADPKLGVPAPAKPKKIVIDFSSPNVAKPMHVGHIRSTILGDALARIATFIGHEVVRDNHIGDWGKQFGMLIVGWKRSVAETGHAPQTIEALEHIYKYINAEIEREKKADGLIVESSTEKTAREELVKLQSGDAENLQIWRKMIDVSCIQFDHIYDWLDVKFDVTLGESFYNPQLRDVVEQLRERGIARESEGAWCVFSDGLLPQKDDPFLIQRDGEWVPMPALVQKSDGAANYTTTDLATLEYRLKTWAPDEIIYVTDGRQQHHFRQLFAIFRRWHRDADVKLAHVWFGSILGEDGKPFKTRSGETIKLADLLDEAEERAFNIVTEKNPALPENERREIARIIGIGAVKYADLAPNRQSDTVFSWDKMLALQGNTAPYLQYSYVRIRSIFRKAAEAGETLNSQLSTLTLAEPQEIALAKKLNHFGEVLPMVLDDHRPNLLANYLYELASTFHGFFEACPVLKSDGATRASRLTLCDLTARVLAQGLALLGIQVPSRM